MEKKILIFLLIILGIASLLRLWQLDSIPPGLYPDVAINGNDALESLRTGHFRVFYPENNGREGLFVWLIALSFSIFGVSIWSIKIVPAIIGILTVLGLYLLTRELFDNVTMKQCNNKAIALLSSFFLAISFWHINFSRIGFRAILLPFILVFSFYFLFKGFRTTLLRLASAETQASKQDYGGQGKILNFIISGIFFGLGFYTYISYRFIVLLLPLILTCWWFIYRKPAFAEASAGRQNLQKIFIINTLCLLFTIFIIALPIGLYFLQNPQDFIGRASPVSIFATENPIKEFLKSLIFHLGMFNFYGDPNWRHNFSGKPELFWPIGILFLIGIVFSIKKLIVSVKNKNCSPFTVHCLLLAWFFTMLLPGILTYEGIPHSLRIIGVIPVVYIFAALGAKKTYEIFQRNSKNKKLLILTSILFLAGLFSFQFDKYFSKWAQRPEVEAAFSKDHVKIGNYLNSLSPEIQKYVIVNQPGVLVNGIPMPAQTPMFIENSKFGKSRTNYLLPENLNQIKIDREARIILMRYEEALPKELSRKFPGGQIATQQGFWLYKIE